METPWVQFYCLLLYLASYFSFFVFLFFLFFSRIPVSLSSSCPFVCAAAICYSQQVRILSYVFFLLVVSLVPYPISEFFCFSFVQFFFVALIPRVAFFLLLCSRTRYASTWFAFLESLPFGFSLSRCLWPQNLYLSRMKNQEGHWGYCSCWVERTVYCEDNNIHPNKEDTKKD